MELEMEIPEITPDTTTHLLDRLSAAAAALESAAARMNTVELEASAAREHELEARLHAAEQTIASLQAAATAHVPATHVPTARKTAQTAGFIAKEAASQPIGSLEAGALDAALTSLSLEQRIAVKAQLLRSGLLG